MAAKILSQKAYNVPGKIKITEYLFEVPRDWMNPKAKQQQLTLFARAASKVDKPADPTSTEKDDKKKDLPWLVFLQGGPGFGCASPQNNYWTQTFLEKGYQVLCLDQRGTGLSTTLTPSTLGLRGDDDVQVQYLTCFRQDSIVKDCEAVRKALTVDLPPEKQKWSVMGQSYGGFCAVTYLSFYPDSLREAFIFGGLPPLVKGPDDVYRQTFRKIIERNKAYYEKFPDDVKSVQQIVKFLQRFGDTTVRDTTSQGYLTARRFMQLGLHFGFHGGLDSVHESITRAHNDLTLFGHLTRPTVSRIESQLPFDDAIIYAILHESIYCQGSASNWSAWRILNEHGEIFAIPKEDGNNPVYFTGETVFPWMFEDYSELRKIKNQAEKIAKLFDWPKLYDEEQLAKNEVPVYAAVYMDDMYVHFGLSQETAQKIKGCKMYITNTMYHDAVRSKMDEVTRGLFALRDDSID